MSLELSSLTDSLRSSQILSDADALLSGTTGLSNTGGASSATSALGSLGALDPSDLTAAVDNATAPVTSLANDVVLDLHAGLEGTADANGLAETVHGVTNLGETVGLGRIGETNLVTSALDLPSQLASGDASGLGALTPEATSIVDAAHGLLAGGAGDAGINPDALGVLTDVQSAVHGIGTDAIGTITNAAIGDFHAELESIFDDAGLSGTVHGVTGLGETIGLSQIGGDNALTDVLDAPGQLLAGDTSSLTDLPSQVTNIVGATEALASGVETDLASGALLSDPVGNVTHVVGDLTNLSSTGLLNDTIDAMHATLEGGLDPIAPGTIHGVTGLGDSIGLGNIGGSNLLTDVLDTPGAAADGDLTPVTYLPADAGSIVAAVGQATNGIGGDLATSPITETLTHPATGDGLLGGTIPGQGVVGEASSMVTGLVANNGGLDGLAGLAGGATGGGNTGGSHDLVTVAAGPQTGTSGVTVNVASNGAGSSHLVDSHVGTVPDSTPTIANVSLLSGGSFEFPAANGGGSDALSGAVSGAASTVAAATSGGSAAHATPDIAHVDVPIDAPHADPLAGLAHAVHV